jgi:hypothetical protein
MPALKSITFSYRSREDRVLAAINIGQADAWSCWLTRRLSLALLERAAKFLESTSPLVQRTPPDHRGELAAFERDAALARTAPAMSVPAAEALNSSAGSAELAERMTITQQGEGFRLELHGDRGGQTAGAVARAELQRILRMLEAEVVKGAWVIPAATSAPAPAPATSVRH